MKSHLNRHERGLTPEEGDFQRLGVRKKEEKIHKKPQSREKYVSRPWTPLRSNQHVSKKNEKCVGRSPEGTRKEGVNEWEYTHKGIGEPRTGPLQQLNVVAHGLRKNSRTKNSEETESAPTLY